MRNTEIRNQQIRTWQTGDGGRTLETGIVEQPIKSLQSGEILIEVLFVPVHGSFWLASHPDGIHPRHDEFVVDGGFVFGNGGVGRVISVAEGCRRIHPKDYVSVMGHLPCAHESCYACRVLHRYTECDFGEGKIVGHGKGAPDGTFSRYCILPEIACEICFSPHNPPSEQELMPYMFGFLFADVRNAMTRDPDSLSKQRMLLFGAGYSGHLAAWLLLQSCPQAKILVVDPLEERLESITQIDPESIQTVALPWPLADALIAHHHDRKEGKELAGAIERIDSRMRDYFGHRKCDLVFDASSGNAAPLWADARVLSPGTHCIPFGFGSDRLIFNAECCQISGLRILMSRGVGDVGNRRAAIELIRSGAADIISRQLIAGAQRLEGLDQALAFIKAQHKLPGTVYRAPRAYIAPNAF